MRGGAGLWCGESNTAIPCVMFQGVSDVCFDVPGCVEFSVSLRGFAYNPALGCDPAAYPPFSPVAVGTGTFRLALTLDGSYSPPCL
jgi:hypothetical protein